MKKNSNFVGGFRKEEQKCGCSNGRINHFEGIHFSLTKHYRDLIHGEDATNYSKRMFVYNFAKTAIDKAIDEGKHLKSGRAKVKIDYSLFCFHKGKIPVCEKVWCKVTGISSGVVWDVVNKAKRGIKPERCAKSKLAEREAKEKPEYLAVATFLEKLADQLSNRSPDMKNTELPSGTKCHYYEWFCEEWKEGVLTGLYHKSRKQLVDPLKPPSKSFFYKIWRNEYSCLHVPKRQNRFSKCDWCVMCKENIDQSRAAGDHVDLEFWKKLLYSHYAWVVLQRKRYHRHRRKAAENPERLPLTHRVLFKFK